MKPSEWKWEKLLVMTHRRKSLRYILRLLSFHHPHASWGGYPTSHSLCVLYFCVNCSSAAAVSNISLWVWFSPLPSLRPGNRCFDSALRRSVGWVKFNHFGNSQKHFLYSLHGTSECENSKRYFWFIPLFS